MMLKSHFYYTVMLCSLIIVASCCASANAQSTTANWDVKYIPITAAAGRVPYDTPYTLTGVAQGGQFYFDLTLIQGRSVGVKSGDVNIPYVYYWSGRPGYGGSVVSGDALSATRQFNVRQGRGTKVWWLLTGSADIFHIKININEGSSTNEYEETQYRPKISFLSGGYSFYENPVYAGAYVTQ